MAAAQKPRRPRQEPLLRQLVVRLEQTYDEANPGLYDVLLEESLKRSHDQGRRVPMTEIVREQIEKLRPKAKRV